MSIRKVVGKIKNNIPVRNVIVSVSDKTDLDVLVNGILEQSPEARFFSTGGTFKRIQEELGDDAAQHLVAITEYTGFPEMDGGLVKTLHPKIHAGILGERSNPKHQTYLGETLEGAVYFDMVVVHLYPFEQVVAQSGVTFEQARGNIDIGGVAMLRAAAKNFLGCAAISSPHQYADLLEHMRENRGCTSFEFRKKRAVNAFTATGNYDTAIFTYVTDKVQLSSDKIRDEYEFEQEGE